MSVQFVHCVLVLLAGKPQSTRSPQIIANSTETHHVIRNELIYAGERETMMARGSHLLENAVFPFRAVALLVFPFLAEFRIFLAFLAMMLLAVMAGFLVVLLLLAVFFVVLVFVFLRVEVALLALLDLVIRFVALSRLRCVLLSS